MLISLQKKAALCISLLLLLYCQVQAQVEPTQSDSLDIYSMSLEELTNLKATGVSSELEEMINSLIGVASKKAVSVRKSPSIISLITQEEISRSGARDLLDVLRLVPGFDFGVDVQGVIGIGIRGNWAHEGKALLLLDGQELNEILYSTIQLGNNFNVDQIKRIEIIRGPGSAIYGGYAEYGVINIITKDVEDLHGIQASATYSHLGNTYGRRIINVSAGKKTKDFAFTLSSFIGQGRRSTGEYTDFDGNTYTLTNSSALNPTNINLGLSYKKLSFRGIYDSYQTTNRDNVGQVYQLAYNNFKSYYADLKYDLEVGKKLTITPRINFKHQIPWQSPPLAEGSTDFNIAADRYRGSLTALYEPNRYLNLTIGSEFFNDRARNRIDSVVFVNGEPTVAYRNTALFAEGILKNRLVNVIIGARYDQNNSYGSAFVPRVGLTKKLDKANFKLLYSSSFRAPGIENIELSLDGNIKPEKTHVLEFEAGYQFTSKMLLTANVYDITTFHPIVYFVDEETAAEGYANFARTGTRGIELEYKVKDQWGYINLNYSFYTAANKNRIDTYAVSGQPNLMLAFAGHKLNVNSSFILYKGLSINPSGTFMSKRFGYAYNAESNSGMLQSFDPVVLANLFVQYENLWEKRVTVGAGVYDLLNKQFQFIQPYNSGHAPLPGPGREFVLKLSYSLNF
ncbi:TonB-dependent receptor plug domain-containing protein [Rhodocytophaga aerolata]|uniref:TonB-dependent receptor plug domain-containing protein n=1 Tax=Rhodocytophaga aerolata TaxID=455078 RepID=A0ABT8RFM4_9BACT|nr:TonB-dependent receptor plug domain-containing protein [Rhodocytophaga aerolata]MDO1450903.1 TonB-dependent receptor plug domain-containing protein [Rhodocytophaga aerolata]